MFGKIKPLAICASVIYSSIAVAQENPYTVSLKEAVEKFSKATKDKDTTMFFSFLSDKLAITARGETQVIGDLAGFKKIIQHQFTNPELNTTSVFQIEEVKAGSKEPVWAGYDRGVFTQTAVSKDGKYNRKVSGPYYRAWRLEKGQWKCYYLGYMAFTCDGDDCK
jgi:ABC-type uncharacterized transport system, ATPase component